MAELNYSNIDNPYNRNLERSSSLNSGNEGVSGVVSDVSSDSETTSGTTTPTSKTTSPDATITSGQSLENLWINSWLKSVNYKPKSQGFLIDGKTGYIECRDFFSNNATITGNITATSGIIGGWTVNATSIYTGTEDHSGYTANAGDITLYSDGTDASIHANKWYVDTSGNLFCTSATVSGAITTGAGSSLDGQYLGAGSVASAAVNLALRGWTQTCVFSATDANTVAWTAGTFTASDGTTYSIGGNNTDARLTAASLTSPMNARVYIYLDIATLTTEYCCTYIASTAIGNGKCLVAVAENGTDVAEFQVFGGIGGIKLSVADLAADSTVTNEFVANEANIANAIITNAKIVTLSVEKLLAGSIAAQQQIEIGTWVAPTDANDVFISSGKHDFDNTDTGFILGIDNSDSSKPKFYIGDSTHYQNWTGSTLRSTGMELCQIFTAGENLTANKFVCFKASSKTDVISCIGDSWADEEHPNNNYGSTGSIYVGTIGASGEDAWAYFKFQTLPANIQTATFHYKVGSRSGNAFGIQFYTLDADFTEGTITWNNKPASTIINGATATISTTGWKTIDISQALISIQRAGSTFYGLAIRHTGGAIGDYFYIDSMDASIDNHLDLVLDGTDGKAYLADYTYYATSRFVIGKTLEAANADASVTVQIGGIMDNISVVSGGTGYPVMLGIAGAISNASLSNLIDKDTHNVELGIALTTSTLLFNPNRGSDFYISNTTATVTGATTSYSGIVYPPLLARKAIIEWTGANAVNSTSNLLTVYKDSNQVATQRDALTSGTSYSMSCSADWSGTTNHIDIAFECDANFSSTPTATVWYYE